MKREEDSYRVSFIISCAANIVVILICVVSWFIPREGKFETSTIGAYQNVISVGDERYGEGNYKIYEVPARYVSMEKSDGETNLYLQPGSENYLPVTLLSKLPSKEGGVNSSWLWAMIDTANGKLYFIIVPDDVLDDLSDT